MLTSVSSLPLRAGVPGRVAPQTLVISERAAALRLLSEGQAQARPGVRPGCQAAPPHWGSCSLLGVFLPPPKCLTHSTQRLLSPPLGPCDLGLSRTSEARPCHCFWLVRCVPSRCGQCRGAWPTGRSRCSVSPRLPLLPDRNWVAESHHRNIVNTSRAGYLGL